MMEYEPPFESGPGRSNAPMSVAAGVTWNLRQVVLGSFLVILSIVVLSAVIAIPAQFAFGEDSGGAYLGQFLATMAWHGSILLIVYRIVRRSGSSWSSLGFRPPIGETSAFSPRVLAITFALSMSARLAVIVLVFLEGLTGLHWLEPSQQIPDSVLNYKWLLPIIGVSIALTAPFAEELLFRAFIFGGVRRYLPLFWAALISGALFSAAHFSPGLFLPFLLIGGLFAYAYERTQSIFVSMQIHFFFNLISFLILAFVA